MSSKRESQTRFHVLDSGNTSQQANDVLDKSKHPHELRDGPSIQVARVRWKAEVVETMGNVTLDACAGCIYTDNYARS